MFRLTLEAVVGSLHLAHSQIRFAGTVGIKVFIAGGIGGAVHRHALPGEPVHVIILIPEAALTVELTGQSAGDVVLIQTGKAVDQILRLSR